MEAEDTTNSYVEMTAEQIITAIITEQRSMGESKAAIEEMRNALASKVAAAPKMSVTVAGVGMAYFPKAGTKQVLDKEEYDHVLELMQSKLQEASDNDGCGPDGLDAYTLSKVMAWVKGIKKEVPTNPGMTVKSLVKEQKL